MNPLNIRVASPEKKGTFGSAFVLPVTRDGRALLTKEKRGSEVKYGMLGGSAHPEETDFQCMSRSAKEESGGALSLVTIARISEGRGIIDGAKVYYDHAKSYAVKHDLVHSVDLNVTERFEPDSVEAMRGWTSRAAIDKKKNIVAIHKKKRSSTKRKTEHLGLEFVPLDSLRSWEWREKNMYHVPSVLTARLMKLG